MSGALSEVEANAVWTLLVDHAGANEDMRAEFVATQTRERCREYRFVGWLGFGGKFYNGRGGWRVDFYPEDSTGGRRQIRDFANAALSGLRASFAAEREATA